MNASLRPLTTTLPRIGPHIREDDSTQIIVVEDDDDDSFHLTRELSRAQLHHFCTVLGEGRVALNFLRQIPLPPVVIFLDLHLPGLSGIELLKGIRKDPRLRDVPVVVMTGELSATDVEACTELGVTSYLPKPIDLVTFMAIVGKLFHADHA